LEEQPRIYCDYCSLRLELIETRVTTRPGPYARTGVHIWKCPRCQNCAIRRFACTRQGTANLQAQAIQNDQNAKFDNYMEE
jgi:DNA-directed RNA polymerase subunit RPC12/RpoP